MAEPNRKRIKSIIVKLPLWRACGILVGNKKDEKSKLNCNRFYTAE